MKKTTHFEQPLSQIMQRLNLQWLLVRFTLLITILGGSLLPTVRSVARTLFPVLCTKFLTQEVYSPG